MNKAFTKIGLSGVSKNEQDDLFIRDVVDCLLKLDKEILCEEHLAKKINYLNKYSYDDKEIIENIDLLISVGGDGTMLSNSKKYGINKIPILGINLGTLGFLTDIQTDDPVSRLSDVIKGKYLLDERPFLQATLDSKQLKPIALNEIVLHSGAVAKMIEFNLFIDNSFVYKQKADGIIIFSPTGSTAYSLSGGGPLVDPNLNVIGIMPMFPHSINTTPILIDDDKEVRIELSNPLNNQGSELSFDSQTNIKIDSESILTISKSNNKLSLVHPLDDNFFSRCRDKLGWGKSIT